MGYVMEMAATDRVATQRGRLAVKEPAVLAGRRSHAPIKRGRRIATTADKQP